MITIGHRDFVIWQLATASFDIYANNLSSIQDLKDEIREIIEDKNLVMKKMVV